MRMFSYKSIVLPSSCGVKIGLEEDRWVETTTLLNFSMAYSKSTPQITYNTYHRYLPRLGIVVCSA
ncbi:MAG: hypothetical protein Q4A56_06395 [Porphyromonadaceae bacterium]|nr:hypothetical protein [Porphyromonadaceae bacterium]